MLDKIVFELADEVKRLSRRISLLEEVPEFEFALREDLQDEGRFLPTKAESLSIGYDVRSAQKDRNPITLRAGQYVKLPLGFKCFCPDGFGYFLHPRSSTFLKKSMHSLIGVIDESWEGETALVAQYIPDISSMGQDLVINFGDPVAQLIFHKKMDVKIKSVSNETLKDRFTKRGAVRGEGGFGSSDNNFKKTQ